MNLLHGLAEAIQPVYLLYGLIGTVLGTAVGVLPGLGKTTTLALLVPVTYQIGDPLGAFIMFGGIYYGAAYGGSTTAILVNTPGEADSVVACLDGHQMARKGRAGAALAAAALGSFIAGTVGTIALSLLAEPMVKLSLAIGPAELIAVIVLAMSLVSFLGGHPLKAAFSTAFGLALGTIGIELNSGQSRFTFGIPELSDGLDFVVVAVGLFAVSEVLIGMGSVRNNVNAMPESVGRLMMTRQELRHAAGAWGRGTVTGFFTGLLPGGGNTVSTFLAYGVEKIFARPLVPLGEGAIEGLAGPEASNNSAAAAGLIPLLFLGIPGSASTAVMLAALQGYGLPTGPLLLQQAPLLVWGLIASLYIANVVLVILNLPLIGIWVRLLKVPPALLYPLILAVCGIGVYSLNSRPFDLVIMLIFGLIGFGCRRLGFPLAPMVLALILAPRLETQIGRALTISSGNWFALLASPWADGIFALAIAAALFPTVASRRRRAKSVDAAASVLIGSDRAADD